MTLRDLAMMIVSMHGPSYRDDFLVIEYRPQHGDAPHGLDIWQQDDRSSKMLSVFWHGDASIVVVCRSGSWEKALHRAAAGIAA